MGNCPYCSGKGCNNCFLSEGGEVKGVHTAAIEGNQYDKPRAKKRYAGESRAGEYTKNSDLHNFTKGKQNSELAKDEHHRVLGEMKSMPKPKLQGLADGGEVDSDGDYDGDMDNELMDACCEELIQALDSKNKKEILESLKAIILSCKG